MRATLRNAIRATETTILAAALYLYDLCRGGESANGWWDAQLDAAGIVARRS